MSRAREVVVRLTLAEAEALSRDLREHLGQAVRVPACVRAMRKLDAVLRAAQGER